MKINIHWGSDGYFDLVFKVKGFGNNKGCAFDV